ncbi:MAG TPA: hypothetical protein VN642_10275 [Dongiaceae bacterium]|nr:hypothetical protein [Dongiaceae bacterium]
MSDLVKTCAMCRKEVDAGAVLCPYCKSSTNYHFYKAVPAEQIPRIKSTSRAFVSAVVLFASVVLSFLFGFAAGGIWIGIGAGIVGGKICLAILKNFPSDAYHHQFCCPGCFKEQTAVWDAKEFDVNKCGFMECPDCHKKTMMVIA